MLAKDYIAHIAEGAGLLGRYLTSPDWAPLPEGDADLRFGNPTELAGPEFVATLQRWSEPRSPDWFAYPSSLDSAREHVAGVCRDERGLDVDPEDVHLTLGAFGGLALVMRLLLGDGDEIVVLDPPWFCYDVIVAAAGGSARHVALDPPRFTPDPDRILDAIGPRTAAVVVNSPHNPTGRVLTDAELLALAEALIEASNRAGRRIALISDEPYWRIVFDGVSAPSPARFYPDTIVVYSYGKATLSPGERIGWVAATRDFAEREALREAMPLAQMAQGWAFPNTVLQRGIADLERVLIDVGALQRRRDRVVDALARDGFEVVRPEGTFYVVARSPDPDDLAFVRRLAHERRVHVLPGTWFNLPGWFRISLTANDAMIDTAIEALHAVAPPRA